MEEAAWEPYPEDTSEGELPGGPDPPEGSFGAASSCKESQVREAGRLQVGAICWEASSSPFAALSFELSDFATFSSCTVVILGR